MPRYNHLTSIGFSVISAQPDGSDLTPAMLRKALLARIRDLDGTPGQGEWLEAVEPPCDSVLVEDVDTG